MNLEENFRLIDLIDTQTLKKAQAKLAKIVNIPVITVDCDGNPIGQNNFTPFCSLIRSSKKGAEQCVSCDSQAGKLAVKYRQARIYDCHLGLKDCVSPIFVNDIFLGAVLGGQVLIEGEQTRDSINVEKVAHEFDIPVDALQEVIDQIPLVSQEFLENCFDFYNFLASYFAQMGMHRLTQEKYLRESRDKLRLEQKAKKMELKTIQAQINPHFLFNTLNSIARMALIEDAPQTEELIYNLSDLLRYSLKNIEDFPKIRDEMNNIERYLFIQTLRFSDRITYNISISEALLDYRIPSMTLQPLVENCLVHGLETKKDGGKVEISGTINDQNEVVLKIEDNGVGITAELLERLNQLENNGSAGIGIINTQERIRHFFGSRYGLHFESIPNAGTSVTVLIPCIKDYPK
ncbi:sensor histidine kinase [Neobacillus niacini]|uniref:sensor histidine kinase n=1 Tax=Neobacillus niacini TaxID=86668 RepID=UPI00203F6706|nr:PocR ligand-binding domain-containing protein [Neobacillus niacini]MCM3691894.1 PocR ligand-binding domain-containing protein [Neobacillus niacini]